MKKLIYFLFLILLSSFVYADYIAEGTLLYPDSMNFTYNITTAITCDNITVNDTCIIITGGTYEGTYCYNLSLLYLSDIVLFPESSPVSCYAQLTNHNNSLMDINNEWLNKSDDILDSDSNTCENGITCLLDTLSSSYITNYADEISCNLNYSEYFFNAQQRSYSLYVNSIGVCDAINQYPILNMSYLSELDYSPISLSNTYNLSFYDGSGTYHLEGNFSGNYSDIICTSVNPAEEIVNLLFYGDLLLDKDGYVSRVYKIPQAAGTIISNNPIGQKDFFLIPVANSSTVSYTWQTKEFQLIDGTLLIYRCNEDGTKSLVEATGISSGSAVANLELLTTAYSYEIVVGGVKYTDDSYTKCRVESETELEFFVDLLTLDVSPVIGLFSVDCGITNTSAHVVRMVWDANTEDPTDITACMYAQRQTINGLVTICSDCQEAVNGSFTRTIPDNGNAYHVYGTITQGDTVGFCKDDVWFYEDNTTTDIMGPFIAFLLGILVFVLALIFAGQGERQLMGAGIAVIFAFILGLFAGSWELVFSILIFLIVIGLVGRYTKKRQTE